MYIINRFIGTCFKGANAKSHDFFVINLLTSVFFETSLLEVGPDRLYAGGAARPSGTLLFLKKYLYVLPCGQIFN
jgi:hypothetical protein